MSLKEKITANFDERSPVFLMFITGLLGWISLLIFGTDWWFGISTETILETLLFFLFGFVTAIGMFIYVPIFFIVIISIVIKHYIENI